MPAPEVRPVDPVGVDGDLAGHLVVPDLPLPRPGVVVLPEVDGYNPSTVAAARRLGEAGYVALSLDLFAPFGGTPPLADRQTIGAWLRGMDDRRQLSDLAAAVGWLARRPETDEDRLGIVGFSVGGRYGMLLSAEPHGVSAVVTFSTRPWPGGAAAATALAPGDRVARLGAPVCAVFGDRDRVIPSEMVRRFADLLPDRAGHEVHVVPGGHLFANETSGQYEPASAEAAKR